jgi:hypothetical protein
MRTFRTGIALTALLALTGTSAGHRDSDPAADPPEIPSAGARSVQ